MAKCRPPKAIAGMGYAYQPPLGLDARYCLLGREMMGHVLREKQPDDLAPGGQYFLTDDDREWSDSLQLQGTGDGIVIGHGEAVDPDLKATGDDLFQ